MIQIQCTARIQRQHFLHQCKNIAHDTKPNNYYHTDIRHLFTFRFAQQFYMYRHKTTVFTKPMCESDYKFFNNIRTAALMLKRNTCILQPVSAAQRLDHNLYTLLQSPITSVCTSHNTANSMLSYTDNKLVKKCSVTK